MRLEQILRMVHLEYLAQRECGWLIGREWRDVLSRSEKQGGYLYLPFKRNFGVLRSTGIDGNGAGVLSTTQVCDFGW